MSRIYVHGTGAVSPAGWNVAALHDALVAGVPPPLQALERPGRTKTLQVFRVPVSHPKPPFFGHPRLRRASPITHFAVGAAIEAIGPDAARIAVGELKLGVIFCAFTGSVNYSRRFYAEVLRDPSTASPLFFTETVFNAPASHIAAYFGTSAISYTVVGDQGEFVKALALAADWLLAGRVDGCLVVGAEESDWLTADALRLLSPDLPASEGAGAVYLRREPTGVELVAVTEPQLFLRIRGRSEAAKWIGWSLENPESNDDLLCDGLSGVEADRSEAEAWAGWSGKRLSPKRVLGEGLAAAGSWQTVAAIECLRRGLASRAVVSIIGGNEQAVGAVWRSTARPNLTADAGQPV